ncbi:sulfotransferase family protein [Micromonospora humida]|uniref:Sulfotransferase n=1 Tax=Micromonospora humida TaxID=2809018 RepID=A0ABS2IQE1_9ACTN|nr:sulfotransferase [Micromonospora humida]MBM7075543.1 sulfotransferase [Micromonospora humida]
MTLKPVNRIQMIGTQRSGSNLVRLVLNGTDEVVAPPSAHEYRDFADLYRYYAPHGPDKLLRLADDMSQLVRLNALPWPEADLTGKTIASHATGRTLSHVVIAMYDALALQTGSTAWVNKCLENHRYLLELITARPDLRVLHLVRDPRDVALSFRKAPIGPKDPWVIAQHWLNDQRSIRELRENLMTKGAHWTTVRYEDVVVDPEAQFESICRELGVAWTSAALRFHSSRDAVTAASLSPLWETLAKPIARDRVGGHKSPSHRQFVTHVEEIASAEMRTFGYEPVYCRHPITLSKSQFAQAKLRDKHLRLSATRARPLATEELHTRRDRYLENLRLRLIEEAG